MGVLSDTRTLEDKHLTLYVQLLGVVVDGPRDRATRAKGADKNMSLLATYHMFDDPSHEPDINLAEQLRSAEIH